MKVTDDGYPSIILGYKVGPYVVMMGTLEPHADIRGMFPTQLDVYVKKGYPLLHIRMDGVPMRSVVETILCNGVKLFMQMIHECLWAY